MALAPLPNVTLTPVAVFPKDYFLENLAARSDGSLLVTALHQKELWHVPASIDRETAEPNLVHTFDHLILTAVEIEHDVFIVSLSDLYSTHESHLARVDLNGWSAGAAVSPEIVLTFDDRVRGLNGGCLVAPGVLLLADCFAGFIWRVDLADDGTASARVWLAHDTMAMDEDSGVAWPPQPGVNGLRYAAGTGYLYYTSTAQKVFMRVPLDPETSDPAGDAEFIAAIDSADDFCIDEQNGFAYVTRHRANTIDRVPLEPRRGSEVRHVAGDPFDELLCGPSSAVWGRGRGDVGRLAYFTTDGGMTAPPDGVVRESKILRVCFAPAGAEPESRQAHD